jgi:hypothetical protein
MIYINESDKNIIDNIIKKYVPNKVDSMLHINPYFEMNKLVYHLIEEKVLPINKKAISLICMEWKTLLYKKFSLFN